MQINEKIKLIRETLKLKQKDFGDPLGISLTHVSKYERGEFKPTFEVLQKLAHIYKINMNWLIADIGNMFIGQEIKKEINEKIEEITEAYEKLPEEKQKYYYHKIIADSLEPDTKQKEKKAEGVFNIQES